MGRPARNAPLLRGPDEARRPWRLDPPGEAGALPPSVERNHSHDPGHAGPQPHDGISLPRKKRLGDAPGLPIVAFGAKAQTVDCSSHPHQRTPDAAVAVRPRAPVSAGRARDGDDSFGDGRAGKGVHDPNRHGMKPSAFGPLLRRGRLRYSTRRISALPSAPYEQNEDEPHTVSPSSSLVHDFSRLHVLPLRDVRFGLEVTPRREEFRSATNNVEKGSPADNPDYNDAPLP